ncbi:MAG: 2OG-Fe(II) oxygenase [Planctomycetes bacterium]|nr:2OG-Fe(II) oxygenase [Planctomycetota bacterium]
MIKRVLVPDHIITVPSFLTGDECDRYINLSEGKGYDDAPITTAHGFEMRPDIRNNTRVILDDFDLARLFWDRIESAVPSPFGGRNAIGLNERFRFYRYDPGQTFRWHRDGAFVRISGERSQFTFMIYLNADFEGGETKFRLPSPIGSIDVRPERGMALLFNHELLHEGATVHLGRKYVLRTDVMYGERI